MATWSKSHKVRLSSLLGSLQLDSMKSESLVIANQNVAVNTFPGLVTPPVTPWEWVVPEVDRVLTERGAFTTV